MDYNRYTCSCGLVFLPDPRFLPHSAATSLALCFSTLPQSSSTGPPTTLAARPPGSTGDVFALRGSGDVDGVSRPASWVRAVSACRAMASGPSCWASLLATLGPLDLAVEFEEALDDDLVRRQTCANPGERRHNSSSISYICTFWWRV